MIVLSVVAPCFNEEPNIAPFLNEFWKISHLLPPTEIIFVDDGSTDNTYSAVVRAGLSCPAGVELKVVRLSRNFGHQLALLAGMREAKGHACVTIDVDLQDPPHIILQMIEKWKEGYEVVLGQRKDRKSDSLFKRMSAAVFYRFMSRLTRGEFPQNVGDFRLVDRKVLNILISLKEIGLYWRGLVVWVGFKRTIVPYIREARHSGETKYPFLKMVSFAENAVFSFSKRPLIVISWLGAISCLVSLLMISYYLFMLIVGNGHYVPGWLSLMCIVTFMGGVQLLCLSILGQYIGRIFDQVLGRPSVIIDSSIQVTKNTH